jgi:hypothetical protein
MTRSSAYQRGRTETTQADRQRQLNTHARPALQRRRRNARPRIAIVKPATCLLPHLTRGLLVVAKDLANVNPRYRQARFTQRYGSGKKSTTSPCKFSAFRYSRCWQVFRLLHNGSPGDRIDAKIRSCPYFKLLWQRHLYLGRHNDIDCTVALK